MDCFAYGTLTDPDRAASVLDGFEYRGEAVIDGLHRVEGRYPTLAPGGTTDGRILRTDDVAALDSYEGVDRGLYVRVAVPCYGTGDGTEDGTQNYGGEVHVYVGDPARLDADAEWPGGGPFEERVERYVREADVEVLRSSVTEP